jgi:ribonuclease HII
MARTAPTDLERDGWERGLRHIVGVDEAGCGPVAGPVVAAAVVLSPFRRAPRRLQGVNDSKLLTADQREALAGEIREVAVACVVAAASAREIERSNGFRSHPISCSWTDFRCPNWAPTRRS